MAVSQVLFILNLETCYSSLVAQHDTAWGRSCLQVPQYLVNLMFRQIKSVLLSGSLQYTCMKVKLHHHPLVLDMHCKLIVFR